MFRESCLGAFLIGNWKLLPQTGTRLITRLSLTVGSSTPERWDSLSPGSPKMASDPGVIDVFWGEEELPYPQEYDYLWTDERNSLQEGNGIWDPSQWFQGGADRQGVAEVNPLAVAVMVGIAYSGLLLANSLLNPLPKPKLENDDMC